ncbi:hypothetical protein M885DRAFT_617935 [Pelagophyceae sp. CCMP2097]|nr:hypothetical protein M885DRAFT_617935 [Pelagophyceae sp. CCMP2097]
MSGSGMSSSIGAIAGGRGERTNRSAASPRQRRRFREATADRRPAAALADEVRDGLKRAEQKYAREDAIGDASGMRRRRKRSTQSRLFDAFDVRRTGTVSRNDCREVLRGVGVVLTDAELRRALGHGQDSGQKNGVTEVDAGRIKYDNGEGYGSYAAAYRADKAGRSDDAGSSLASLLGSYCASGGASFGAKTLGADRGAARADEAEAEMAATMRTSSEVAPLRQRLKRADGPVAGFLAPCDFMRVLRDFGAGFDGDAEEALCDRYAVSKARPDDGYAAPARGPARRKGWSDDAVRAAMDDGGAAQMVGAKMVDYEDFADRLERRADVRCRTAPAGGARDSTSGLCGPREDVLFQDVPAARRRAVRKISDVFESDEQRERWSKLFSHDHAEMHFTRGGNGRVAQADALAALEALGVDLTPAEKPEALRLAGVSDPSSNTEAVDVHALTGNARGIATSMDFDRERLRDDEFRRHYATHDHRDRGRSAIRASTPFLRYHSADAASRPWMRPAAGRLADDTPRARRDRLTYERATSAARAAAGRQEFADALALCAGDGAAFGAPHLRDALAALGAPLSQRDAERVVGEAERGRRRGRSLAAYETPGGDARAASVESLRGALRSADAEPARLEEPVRHGRRCLLRGGLPPRPPPQRAALDALPAGIAVDVAADAAMARALESLRGEANRTYAPAAIAMRSDGLGRDDSPPPRGRDLNPGLLGPSRGRGTQKRADSPHPWRVDGESRQAVQPIFSATKSRSIADFANVAAAPRISRRRCLSEPPFACAVAAQRGRRTFHDQYHRLPRGCRRRSNSAPRPLSEFVDHKKSLRNDLDATVPMRIAASKL